MYNILETLPTSKNASPTSSRPFTKNLKEHFAEKFGVSEDDVQCLPKPTGQQVGAKIVVKDPRDPGNPKVFYAKSHQEFCSRSDALLGTRTSNGTGFVDLKELFMYKGENWLRTKDGFCAR
jgi:hypothetical protein